MFYDWHVSFLQMKELLVKPLNEWVQNYPENDYNHTQEHLLLNSFFRFLYSISNN